MHINEAIAEAHNTAVTKGFWDKEWNLGEKLMLVTSELGEALEADRTDKYANKEKFNQFLHNTETFTEEGYVAAFKENLKDSFEDEMADAIIRLFDLAGKMNVDLEYHIRHKMNFNATRNKLHGKKY